MNSRQKDKLTDLLDESDYLQHELFVYRRYQDELSDLQHSKALLT